MPRDIIRWSTLTVEGFKLVFIDLIHGHHRYYISTGQIPCGGYLFPENARCCRDGEQQRGVLVDLDSLRPSDPLLLACAEFYTGPTRTMQDIPRPRIGKFTEPAAQCVCELFRLLEFVYGLPRIPRPSWEEPGPFHSKFASMCDSWLRPLWRLASDAVFLKKTRVQPDRRQHEYGEPTHERLLAIIVKTALLVPLPLPAPAELPAKPAFQSLIHIATVAQFKRAVIDIANAINKYNDAALCFPALTSDRMLFQDHNLSSTSLLGFVLDLDPLDAPNTLTACAGAHPAALARRFAAYDLISGPSIPPPRALLPRHAFEALFNALVWFYVCNQFSSSSNGAGRLSPRPRTEYAGTWLDPAAHALPSDRTSYTFKAFLQSRRAFLWDGAVLDAKSKSRTDHMCQILWLDILIVPEFCAAPRGFNIRTRNISGPDNFGDKILEVTSDRHSRISTGLELLWRLKRIPERKPTSNPRKLTEYSKK
ncbi:hypothetical protein B0H17DRAFT_1123679 [Mycena rosella]|uniref:Uncharacterized protein n=1 Tax=Mycena rosella TaxID=1033263 RepID=A0AAD7H396_MYCRO|nr:hypothetical protein B0H17DRAFT_1123679 [Mycena rosella]